VIKGKGIGKTIHFPTANIDVERDYKLIPKNGVYVIKSNIDDRIVFGMMNIGTNPTFNENKQSVEVHFFNTNTDLYGRSLKIEILKRLRDEEKFKSIEQLTTQLHLDQENALTFIQKQNE